MRKLICRFAIVATVMSMQGARVLAAENIVLWCDGTLKHISNGGAPEHIKDLGVVVSVRDKTVSFAGHTVPITKSDPANITFGGRESLATKPLPAVSDIVVGDIDRVTGSAAITLATKADTQEWVLICRRARRLF